MTAKAVSFEEVSFRYPGSTADALHEVSLALDEGTFALAVGSTGAGKSTLLRAVNGLVPQFTGGRFSGRVVTAGRDTMAHAPRRMADAVAFVPQDPAASFVLDRVEDELAYGMENLGIGPAIMRRRIEEVLDLLDIEPLRSRSVRTLSGGERQRVAIGAALAAGPRILVLDEPTSQLDPQGAEHVLAALHRLVHDHGMTVLLAEHRLERVAGEADVAVGFERGRVSVGPPAAIVGSLSMGPPVTRLGRMLGWDPLPLTIREARARGLVPPAHSNGEGVASGPALAQVRGLVASYAGMRALRRVDLELRTGEVLAVMGRNGAGKSTLLRSLAGLHPPDEGTVTVRGRAPEPGIDVALCPQEPEAVLFADTVAGEVAATLRARGLAQEVKPLVEALGIGVLAGAHPRDLSAGERLLVAVAAVAASNAPLLLLDEPTRGLDPEAKRRLTSYLRARASVGGSVVVATHDVELVAEAATRVAILAGGEVVADGAPGEILGDSQVFAPQMTKVFGPGWLTPEQVVEAVR